MESSIADIGRIAPPPRRWVIDRRLMGVAIAVEIATIFLAYMVVYVPVLGPKLTHAEAMRHWTAALIAAMVVVIFDTLVIRAALRARNRGAAATMAPARETGPTRALPRIPRVLRIESVPAKWWRGALVYSLAT